MTTALYLSGWWGFRNIFFAQEKQPRANTFEPTESDASLVEGVVDHYHSFRDQRRDDIIAPGTYEGDAAAVAALSTTIADGTAADLSIIYLYDCDRTGHAHGFGPQVSAYVKAIEVMMREKVQPLLDTIAARQAAAIESEEWLVLVTTDHGGSARASMERPIATRFDRLRNGNAFGQRAVEGVHGMQELKAHTNTFLLVVAPPHVDRGGEILDDDVKNSDVTATLLEWFGADHTDLPGKPRGVGLGKDFSFDLCSGRWCDERCCSSKHLVAPRKRRRPVT